MYIGLSYMYNIPFLSFLVIFIQSSVAVLWDILHSLMTFLNNTRDIILALLVLDVLQVFVLN